MCVEMDVALSYLLYRIVNIVKSLIITNGGIIIGDNLIKARKYGAVKVIVDAIKTHTSNASVCEQGCKLIWIITADEGKP